MGGFSSTASSLDLTKHKKGSVINDPAVGCMDTSGNHFFSANLLSLFRVGSWTKAPDYAVELFTVAISSFRNGGEFGASEFHRSRESSTTSIVSPQFTASATARISICRLAALFQN